MARYLMVDIGAGTMDILYVDTEKSLEYKAVVKSPVRCLAEAAAAMPGDLFVDGCEMGGGSLAGVLRQRAQTHRVVMTAEAAATLHHDADRVRAWGIEIVSADTFTRPARMGRLKICDLDAGRIRRIVKGLGVPWAFDVLCVCAQDHGKPPRGRSHLDYRHDLFRERLNANPSPRAMIHRCDRVPPTFTRLAAICASAAQIPAAQTYAMDSGMAAISGACLDPAAVAAERVVVLDVATSHTVGAALVGGELFGFFEYHTQDISARRLDDLIVALTDGRLSHEQILSEGGHGAYIRRSFGFHRLDAIVATGPRRGIMQRSKLPIVWGAPRGDNMMTGTAGMLDAVGQRMKTTPDEH